MSSEHATPRPRRGLVLTAILLAMFLSAMEATVVATAMPTVIADLQGLELYGWVGSLYMLASTLTIPLWGKLADLRGRRPAMLAGLVLFLGGSLVAGQARSMLVLVLARAVQGVGAGALQPVSITIVGDLYALEERAKVQGLFSALWGSAGVLGPLLGGLLVRVLSWRWVFYINLPFGLLAGALLVLFFRERPANAGAPLRFDAAGALLLSVSVLSTLLGASGRYPLVLFPLAVASLAGFLYAERRAPEPLLPLSLFASRTISVASVAGTLMGAVMMASLLFLPLYVQAVRGGSPTEAGTAVAPMLVGWPLASLVGGRLLKRLGPRPLVRTGLFAVFLGTLTIYLSVQAHAPLGALRGCMFLFGVGMGLANTALLLTVQESVAWKQRGVATASTMFFRSIGGAVAVGALGSLLALRLRGTLDEAQLEAMLGPERGRGLDAAALARVASAVDQGMAPLFQWIAGMGALAAVSGWLFPQVALGERPRESLPTPGAE